jgi:hypothetical protein
MHHFARHVSIELALLVRTLNVTRAMAHAEEERMSEEEKTSADASFSLLPCPCLPIV